MQKNKLKRILAKIFKFSSWKIALILILLLYVDATLLRVDHLKMTDLRAAVLAADEAEDDEAIAAALTELRDFTRSHIIFNVLEDNGRQKVIFGTGPLYLEHQYIRKAQAELARAQEIADRNGENPNGNIYRKAADVCDAQGKRYGWRYPDQNYINCWMEELAKYPTTDTLASDAAHIPPTELYRFDYASPIWYPCLSGICILISIILLVLLVVRFITWFFLRLAIFALDHGSKK